MKTNILCPSCGFVVFIILKWRKAARERRDWRGMESRDTIVIHNKL